MKRSEMEAVIFKIISEDEREGNHSTSDLTDKLLEAIETAGMLPPPRVLENVTDNIKYYHCFEPVMGDDEHVLFTEFWEKE